MLTVRELKVLLIAAAVLIAVYLPILLYLTSEAYLEQDPMYIEIYGLSEEGDEW
ncbi:hypothetical protein [Jeotgalicoccus sp. FSL K6-3177]|uniref:hypothetical protein n=1 Tax=Jeotgalicoccus sp. FSL K6-3177 TaxID=2921494 RepID=UPI0030FDE36E